MAKKKKNKVVRLSLVALIFGLLIGLGGSIGITTLTYDEKQNEIVNKNNSKPSTTNNGVKYDDLQIHFLELGNKYAGDCTYIKANDIDILIDAGSRADSIDDIMNYINIYCTDGKLEYVIATHGHQDHIAALVGNASSTYPGGRDGIMNQYKIDNFIYFALTNNNGKLIQNFNSNVDYLKSTGTKCITAKDAYNLDKSYDLGTDMTLNILYNKYYFEHSSDENNYSVISMLSYKDHHFLFTGDLEKEGEEAFASYYSSNPLPTNFELFKGGHHGSKTSSNDCLLDLIQPQKCAVCCCAGSTEYTKNRVNTFPTQAFINRIANYTDEVYITSMWNEEKEEFQSMNGNITISSNGNEIGLAASNNLLKLKDTEWFSHIVYVNDKDQIVDKGTPGAKEVPCRELPEKWKK